MEADITYERYPLTIIALSNLLTASIYTLGAYLMAQLWIWLLVPYLLYCAWVEYRVLSKSCVNCCYYGKLCAFGKGQLCSALLKQGEPRQFAQTIVQWHDMLPEMMLLGFPAVAAVAVMIRDFGWLAPTLLVVLVVLSFAGNGIVRGTFACRHCKQRVIGCPAERLFSKSPKGS
jgi:hypothetical protein